MRGFSLLELLVVVAVIGALAATGIIGYQNYSRNAKIKTGAYNMNTVFRYMLNVRQQIPLAKSLGGTCEIKLSGECVNGTDDPIEFLREFRRVSREELGFENPIFPDCPITMMFYTTTNPASSAMSQYGIVQNALSVDDVSTAGDEPLPSGCRTQETSGREYVQGAIYFHLTASSGMRPLDYFAANMYMPCEAIAQGEFECR